MIYLCEEEKHRHGVWIVEGVTNSSEWCTTLFIGIDAEKRAKAYTNWMNHAQEMALCCCGYDGGPYAGLIGIQHLESCPAYAFLNTLKHLQEPGE